MPRTGSLDWLPSVERSLSKRKDRNKNRGGIFYLNALKGLCWASFLTCPWAFSYLPPVARVADLG